jgi:hypothetical protein
MDGPMRKNHFFEVNLEQIEKKIFFSNSSSKIIRKPPQNNFLTLNFLKDLTSPKSPGGHPSHKL